MLHNILIERKVYASEEHKMMQGMIQEFISNEILDQVDEWEKNGMVSREIWTRARIGPFVYGHARNVWRWGIGFYIQFFIYRSVGQKRNKRSWFFIAF